MRDRCDYRAMNTNRIVGIALDEGIDAEMAVVMAERLSGNQHEGQFHFNHSKETTK